jgi:hypothetical protein
LEAEHILTQLRTICALKGSASIDGMEVEFNTGAVYQYYSVPQAEFENLTGADSMGRYFNANIKGRYSHMKL